jgi:cysteine desulfurase/selenocysteine lyase
MLIEGVRALFPILKQTMNGHPLVYLDSAATTQKPQAVIDRIVQFYTQTNANVHRSVYGLSEAATEQYEGVRVAVAEFIHAKMPHEIVFTRGATEAINCVATAFERMGWFRSGDEILISLMEHHSNIVPWQMICERTGVVLKIIALLDNGELDLADYSRKINARTKFISVVHVSNSLGTVNPVKAIVEIARASGYEIPVLIDGAQAVAHGGVDVQALGCDFYVFSGHKMYGPMGIGVLYGRYAYLEQMPPYQGGGEMIQSVSFEKTLYHAPPYRFEAGTPSVADAIGLGEAIGFIQQLGTVAIRAYEQDLLAHATEVFQQVPGIRVIGQAPDKGPVLSFVISGCHAQDVGTLLNQYGIAVRTGALCTMPLLRFYGLDATIRVSFGVYNHRLEIDDCLKRLLQVCAVLKS